MRKAFVPMLVCAVMVLLAAAPVVSAWDVLKGPQGPRASAVTWDYTPTVPVGNWDAKIVNNGLRSLVVDVFDMSSGAPEQISHERIRFAAYDAYPSGTVYSDPVPMRGGTLYQIIVTPNGPRGSTAVVTDEFVEDIDDPPIADFTWIADYLAVTFDASLSSDDYGIVDFAWNFGDSMTGSGLTVTHTYAAAGTYTVTLVVTDAAAQTDSQSYPLTVEAPPTAGKTTTVYAIGEEPWGEWWGMRTPYYATDFMITDSTTDGFSSMLFLPSRSPALAYQGIIYAPSRVAIDAVGLTTMSVAHPELMPVFGTSAGTPQATMEVYAQYISQAWWDSYWVPTWLGDAGFPRAGAGFFPGSNDGYYMGTTYQVTMNRDAAALWMNLPTTEDPVAWWAANKASYVTSWNSWISNEGNTRLDIYCAYEWTYDYFGTMMNLAVDTSGNVVLSIGHINWGYEALLCRWMAEVDLIQHQPWWEDFSMTAVLGASSADVATDGVAQYSVHAVKANKTASGAAWVFEPIRMDYITKVGHPSEYNLYRTLYYTSWNAGDVFLGTLVPYESTPGLLNLAAGDKLIIQAPTGAILGFQGVALPEYAYDMLAMGDRSEFMAISLTGTVSLGYFRTAANEAGQPDLMPGWDSVTKTLTIVGPTAFDNFHHANGGLYHGAPWIEFNVVP